MSNPNNAKFISFASPKGGVGKSTNCLALAGALLARGDKVRIIDFDQTETILRWYTTSPAMQQLPNLKVEKGPTSFDDHYVNDLWRTSTDYVLIDLAGSLSDVTLLVASFATLTITPAKVSEPDIMEANKMAQKISAVAQRIRKPINHRVLLNEMPSSVSKDEVDLIEQIDDAKNLARFSTIIRRRAAYSKIFSRGSLLQLTEPLDLKATAEVGSLLSEIDIILGSNQLKAAA
jgi:chromosome partitioning protein